MSLKSMLVYSEVHLLVLVASLLGRVLVLTSTEDRMLVRVYYSLAVERLD